MSHKVVLAHRTARGWSGVHIQWGLPAWVLPDLHDRIRQAAKANPNAAGRQDPQDSQDPQAQWRAAMGSVIASDIAGRRTGYMRYPREPFERGNGVIGKRSTSWGIAHEVLYVLDEDTATIEISVRERCPEHGPQLAAHQQAEGVADRRVQSRQPTTCAWGVTDEVDDRGTIIHPKHLVPGCGCLCSGSSVMRWQPLLTYPVSDQRVPDLFAVLEPDGTNTRTEVERVAQLLFGPDGTAELYLALRRDGADHDTAWQAAHVTYADPDPLVP